MKEGYLALINGLIFLLITLTTLVVPLFFLPTTSEFYDFNKLTAFLALTIIATLLWAIKMIVERRFAITHTPINLPLIILTIIFLIASLTSIDQYYSLAGASGKIWPSLLSTVTLVAFFFLTISNLKTRRQVEIIAWTLAGGITLACVLATFSYFGFYLPWDFAQIRSFNPVGTINRLAMLAALVIPITLSWAIFSKSKQVTVVATTTTCLMFLALILANFWPANLALSTSVLVLIFANLTTKINTQSKIVLASVASIFVILLVLRFVPQVSRGTLYVWIQTKDIKAELNIAKEITLSQKAGWEIAASAIGKRPLFGTGPATFQFAFTQLKPRSLNANDSWAIRHDKSSSEFAEIITTVGIVGTLAYLILLVAIMRFMLFLAVKSPNRALYLPLIATIAGFLVANLFSVSSFTSAYIFFLILALVCSLAKSRNEAPVFDLTVELAALKNKFAWLQLAKSQGLLQISEKQKTKSQVLPILFLLFIIVISTLAARFQLRAYLGEYFYRQSLLAARSNDGNRTINFLQLAIRANPNVDTYHRTLAQTTLTAAINLSQKKDLTEKERQLLAQLATVTIDQAKIASGYQILPLRVPGISSVNVQNWETLSAVYQALIGAVAGSETHAQNALTQAVALDPENPILHDRLGQLYGRVNNLDLAQRKFEDSIIVKGDYGPGHWRLAKILIDRQADVQRIVNELQLAKQFLPKEDQAQGEIDSLLEDYSAKLQEQKEQSQTPQANPSPKSSPSPKPSPKSSPTPTPTPSPSPTPSPTQQPEEETSPSPSL